MTVEQRMEKMSQEIAADKAARLEAWRERRKASPVYQHRQRVAELSKGHYFENGEKRTLSVRWVDSFSYETRYGMRVNHALETDCGKIVRYTTEFRLSGKYFPEGIFEISATIKHAEYKGRKETRLVRAKW